MFIYKGPRRRVENVFDEIMTENFLNLKKQTARYRKQRPLNKMNPKTATPRHTKLKMTKAKENSNKGTPIWVSADFSAGTFQTRREWQDIFKVPKGKTYSLGCFTQQCYHSELKKNFSD